MLAVKVNKYLELSEFIKYISMTFDFSREVDLEYVIVFQNIICFFSFVLANVTKISSPFIT